MSGGKLFWKLAVKDVGELQHWLDPGQDLIADPHVTVLVTGGHTDSKDLSPNEVRQAEEVLLQMLDSEMAFDVTAVIKHRDMIVAEVATPDDMPCAKAMLHMVLWHSKLIAPTDFVRCLRCDPDAACCLDSMCFDPPLSLQGTVTSESPEDPAFFAGTMVKVVTQPRPTAQAEPKGHATWLDEEMAEKWKARLAASAKEQPVGPEESKLKVTVQGVGKPGHVYLRWSAKHEMTAKDLVQIIETRLRELV